MIIIFRKFCQDHPYNLRKGKEVHVYWGTYSPFFNSFIAGVQYIGHIPKLFLFKVEIRHNKSFEVTS